MLYQGWDGGMVCNWSLGKPLVDSGPVRLMNTSKRHIPLKGGDRLPHRTKRIDCHIDSPLHHRVSLNWSHLPRARARTMANTSHQTLQVMWCDLRRFALGHGSAPDLVVDGHGFGRHFPHRHGRCRRDWARCLAAVENRTSFDRPEWAEVPSWCLTLEVQNLV